MNLLEEIQNAPVEWKELGEVCIIANTARKPVKANDRISGEIPYYGANNIQDYVEGYTHDGEYILIAEDGSAKLDEYSIQYVNGKFWANNHVHVIKPKENLLSRFIYHYLTNFDFKPYLSGGTRAKLTKASLVKIPLPVPSLEIQEKIVQTLDKFTDYVTELTSELTLRQKQYAFYRDKLLSFEDEVYEVEWKAIGEVAECLAGATPKTTNPDFWGNGTIPWMSSGEVNKGFVYDTEKKITQLGYDSASTKLVPKNTVVIALAGQGKTRGTVALTKIELCTNQSLCSIITKDNLNSHYLYYYLKGQYQKLRDISSGEGTRGGLNLKMIREFQIPVPPLDIQEKIVHVLDNFDTVCNDLNIGLPKEIELRQKQYEYFRDQLLTYAAEGVYTDSTVQYRQDLIRLLWYVFGPIKVSLGVICDFMRGNGLQKKDFVEQGKPVIHYGQIYTKYSFSTKNTLSFTTQEVFDKLKKAAPNDIVMATTSENVEDVGKAVVWEGNENIGVSGDAYIIRTSQNARFLNYYFKSSHFQIQKERKVTGTKVVRIHSKDMENFIITLPQLSEQERIVSILDKFDTLTSDLSQGLPKEIALRQKEYEYWRDCLLKFN